MQAPQTPKESVNTTAWAKWFEFSTAGNDATTRQLEAMVNAAARFTKALKAGSLPYWLSLLGTSGAGKTYLTRRLWRWYQGSPLYRSEVEDEEIIYPGSWVFWPKLAGELLGNQGYEKLDELRTEKLVVFDEIGADRDPSGHVRDCLARVLSARVGKWTVITSNKSLGEIQRDIDTRISSRMLRDGSEVVDVDVPDFSLSQRKAAQ